MNTIKEVYKDLYRLQDEARKLKTHGPAYDRVIDQIREKQAKIQQLNQKT